MKFLLQNKIYNWLTFSGILVGLFIQISTWGIVDGAWTFLQGLSAGIAVLGWMYLLGYLGAGDVKLLGAIGAVSGWQFVVMTAVMSILFGGVLAIFQMVFKKRQWDFFSRIQIAIYQRKLLPSGFVDREFKLPFGVAIAVASVFILMRAPVPFWGVAG